MHIVHALFTEYKGGLEQAFINDTEALHSKGHKITCFVRDTAPYVNELAPFCEQMLTFKPSGINMHTWWKMRNQLQQLRPDIIIVHNGRAMQWLFWASRGLGIPLCGVTHSYKIRRTLRYDALVVLSRHMLEHFQVAGFPKERLHLIPNLMHLPMQHMPHARDVIPVIGTMGRLSPEKGFADFLQALAVIKKIGCVFKARIAGDGPQYNELRTLAVQLGIDADIEWLGWIKDKETFYRSLDIFCLPSHQESLPMVIIEALAYGVATIITDVPGPASMLNDGVDGLIVPRRNPQALAEALQKLIANPEMAAAMADAGRQTVQQYDFSVVAEKWDALLNELVSPATLLRQAA